MRARLGGLRLQPAGARLRGELQQPRPVRRRRVRVRRWLDRRGVRGAARAAPPLPAQLLRPRRVLDRRQLHLPAGLCRARVRAPAGRAVPSWVLRPRAVPASAVGDRESRRRHARVRVRLVLGWRRLLLAGAAQRLPGPLPRARRVHTWAVRVQRGMGWAELRPRGARARVCAQLQRPWRVPARQMRVRARVSGRDVRGGRCVRCAAVQRTVQPPRPPVGRRGHCAPSLTLGLDRGRRHTASSRIAYRYELLQYADASTVRVRYESEFGAAERARAASTPARCRR